ncbi:hypothetical protein BFJ70_g16403 [Fusarium oxysporum]|nr:hypothetical protein BFJ70_g16403 [Fusarium oxysporum]
MTRFRILDQFDFPGVHNNLNRSHALDTPYIFIYGLAAGIFNYKERKQEPPPALVSWYVEMGLGRNTHYHPNPTYGRISSRREIRRHKYGVSVYQFRS